MSFDLDHLALLRELDGVAHEVEEHLAEPAGVADQRIGHVLLDLADQFQPLLVGAHGQRAQGGAQHGAQREIGRVQFQAAGVDLGEVQEVVDDPEEGVRRRLDRRQVLPLLGRQLGVQRQLGHAEDGVHGGADLVADVGQELVLGTVGRLRRLLGPPQLLLGLLALGHIDGHGDHPPPAVRQTAQGGGVEIPDPRLAASGGDPVLALVEPGVQVVQPLDVRLHRPPSLAVGPPRPVRRGAQLPRRVTGQFCPCLADLEDLAPLGMDQDRERRVKDGLAELLLALAQRLFHLAATGNVQKGADAAADVARRTP
jgi:hypothetical protein